MKRFISVAFFMLLLLLPACVLAGYAPKSLTLCTKGLLMVSDADLPFLITEPEGDKIVYLTLGRSVKLQVQANPSGSSKGFRLESSDENVVNVDQQTIKALGRGVCTVTIVSTAEDSVRTPFTVAVGTPVKELKILTDGEYYDVAKPCSAALRVIPEDADYQHFYWKSNSENVFTVDENGRITPHKTGYATLLVESGDGSRTKTDAQLRFVNYPTAMQIEGTADILAVNRSIKLSAMLSPDDHYTNGVRWFSSDPEIASVDEKGTVRGIAPGEVTIHAQSIFTEGLEASYPLRVIVSAEEITCDCRSITLNIGETWKPPFHVKPVTTPYEDLNFVLDNENAVRLNDDGSITALAKGKANLRLRSVYGKAYADLKVTVYDSDYREWEEVKPGTETFVFGYSELGRRLLCTRLGEENAAHRILLTFCMHGYEDEFTRDGLLLTKIAQRLIGFMAGKTPKDWALYLVPCMNPDGLVGGKSNNGFGRCNAKSKDINRDFPVGWERRKDNRNATGANPFATAEGQALARLAESIQPELTVDVHGYIAVINGKPCPEAQIFGDVFGLNVKRGYDGGTFYLWAEQEFGKAFLLELKKPDDDYVAYVTLMAQQMECAINQIMERNR